MYQLGKLGGVNAVRSVARGGCQWMSMVVVTGRVSLIIFKLINKLNMA